ncbi:DUF3102 domain-containing protein [Nitratireductor aquimarinus]|nr:hypothetical protein [Filomicrobium sp.]
MSEPRRCESAPKRGETMSTSVAAYEAFELLNAGTKDVWRGWGDTQTAARDRAAEEAGITPAQAERLWKHWKTMKSVNGDVYRCLRNRYGHLCSWLENKADAMERQAQAIEEINATDHSPLPALQGMAQAQQCAEDSEEKLT